MKSRRHLCSPLLTWRDNGAGHTLVQRLQFGGTNSGRLGARLHYMVAKGAYKTLIVFEGTFLPQQSLSLFWGQNLELLGACSQ